ncbi:MAG: MinD/ParA family protein [Alphaproteobacteria bacterium]
MTKKTNQQPPLPLLDIAPDANNIIAVASGKGGVGKTWFSLTLAHSLAITGRRVLIFDGDLGLANVDIQLGLMPETDLSNVIAGQKKMKDIIQRYDDPTKKVGFDIIAGHSGAGTLSTIPTTTLMSLRAELASIARDYDIVIIDLGAGVDVINRQFVAEAKQSIIVTTPDPTAITDAYAFIKVTTHQYPDIDFQIVVNQVSTIKEGNEVYAALKKTCDNFLGKAINNVGIIRYDKKVPSSIRFQKPLLELYPDSKPASDMKEITKRVLKILE